MRWRAPFPCERFMDKHHGGAFHNRYIDPWRLWPVWRLPRSKYRREGLVPVWSRV